MDCTRFSSSDGGWEKNKKVQPWGDITLQIANDKDLEITAEKSGGVYM